MSTDPNDLLATAQARFAAAEIPVADYSVRRLPDEIIVVVSVESAYLAEAVALAPELDDDFAARGEVAFVSVRRVPTPVAHSRTKALSEGVRDERALLLRQLLTSRSRTSEIQPSLSYIPDAAMNIGSVVAPRHHLIFGRRGAGKTALLAEAKRRILEENHLYMWLNLQTYNRQSVERVFLYFLEAVCDAVLMNDRTGGRSPSIESARRLQRDVQDQIRSQTTNADAAQRLIPDGHNVISRFLLTTGARLYIFLDDYYLLRRADQAPLLDMLHSCVRDADAWLKVASIRNLTKWYLTSPPTGLQIGQDADLIDLDLTLQEPKRTKEFLETVLQKYADDVGVRSLTTVFSGKALDRLVLASGGVPRDYLVLAGASIIKTRERPAGKLVGAQDVNKAAGDAAQLKLQELEDDVSSNAGLAEQATSALTRVRSFCLDEKGFTYFRVDFRDKERQPDAYGVLTRLVEFRLAHLVASSVSDAKKAGERYEVFMLDLSQFSGARLKHKIRVIDLVGGQIVSLKTREGGEQRTATTPNDLLVIYRSAPVFELSRLSDLVLRFEPIRTALLGVLQEGVTRTAPELVAELNAPYREIRLALAELVESEVIEEAVVSERAVYRLTDARTDRSVVN